MKNQKVTDLTEKELLEKIAISNREIASNTNTTKNILIVYLVASVLVGLLIAFSII